MEIKLALVIPNLFAFYFLLLLLFIWKWNQNNFEKLKDSNKSKCVNKPCMNFLHSKEVPRLFFWIGMIGHKSKSFFISWKVTLRSLCILLFIVCFLTLICIVVLLCCISIWISIVCFHFKIIFEIQIKIKIK